MSSLIELIKMGHEAYPNAVKRSQDAQANAIALDNARRAQQERMDLKALYAQQANPSYQAIGAISPEYAQTAMKNQLEMQQAMMGMRHQQAQTGEIEDKMERERAKIRAQVAVPIVDMYYERLAKGVPQDQALQMFHSESGQALSNFQQQGLIDKNFPPYDPNTISPEAVENASAGLGFPSRRLQSLQESAKTTAEQQARVNVGVPMSAEQQYGGVEQVPGVVGAYQEKPALGGAPQMQMPDEMTAQLNSINSLLQTVQEPTARGALIKARNDLLNTLPPEQGSAIVSPEQARKLQIKQTAEKEREIKTAQIEPTEKAADKKAIETYFRGPKPEAIRNLIKESIEGDVQSGLARLGKFFGVAVPGGDALAALKVIQQQMARSLPYAPGGASDIDVRNRLEMISNPATDEPIVNRLRALEEVIRDAEAYVVQKGDFLSEDQILDSVTNGYLSEASALEMINNRMLNKGNPIYAPTQGNKTSTGVK
jgi:hypothetical protein